MKILCPLKRVPDPELKTTIKDGTVDLSSVQWVPNTFDEYAVEAALRLVENAESGERHGEVVVVTIGTEESGQQLRTTLAMGADRSVLIDGRDENLDAGVVARTLVKIYEEEQPDLVLMGKQAVDGDANQVGQMLAELLGLPQATFAASIELAKDQRSVVVGREVDDGVEYKKVPLPSVVTVDLRIVSPKAVVNHVTPESHQYQEGPRYASLKGIMQAKKKPMDKKTFGDLGVAAEPLVKQLSVEPPPERPPGQIVDSALDLVKRLQEEVKAL